ncbi:hypothetical protein K456DRAFT_1332203 [Colletotrichum gloeosporioides 23]|nr:hypothetical protein K456DRAFT_1332203 [Colletotrichum gloeosporioides 23]
MAYRTIRKLASALVLSQMTSMNAPGKPKARQSEVTQKGVMGISATKVAKIAGWPKSTIRLSGVKDAGGKIVWDSPSVFPAEWLHRSAFSWGNETTNNGLTQRSSNLVFGSSETNSKMTRYEKAWQQLFYIEKGISDRMGEQNSSAV